MAKRKKRPAKRRAVRLPPEARAIVDRRRTRFKEECGRDPQGNEPVFFDAAADESEPADAGAVLAALITAMKKAKVNPAKIHAVRRTGRIITRELAVAFPPGPRCVAGGVGGVQGPLETTQLTLATEVLGRSRPATEHEIDGPVHPDRVVDDAQFGRVTAHPMDARDSA